MPKPYGRWSKRQEKKRRPMSNLAVIIGTGVAAMTGLAIAALPKTAVASPLPIIEPVPPIIEPVPPITEEPMTQAAPVVSYPVSVKDIIDGLLAENSPGRALRLHYRTAVVAPPGITTTVTVPVRQGFVVMVVEQFLVASDFYSPLVNGLVMIDGALRTPFGIVGTQPLTLGFSLIEVVRDNFTVTITNATVAPPITPTITVDGGYVIVEKALYDDVIKPLVERSFQHLIQQLGAPLRV